MVNVKPAVKLFLPAVKLTPDEESIAICDYAGKYAESKSESE